MELDHYQVLGLSPSATTQEIKDAYRSLVRLHHPDANPERREASEALMKDVLVAYAVLSDPEKRSVYDRDERIREIERINEKSDVRVYHHAPQYNQAPCGPTSLMGRVRSALGDSQEEFAKRLGLSEDVLCSLEKRDTIPQSPIQFRTFTNLVDQAVIKLNASGKGGEAEELKTQMARQKSRKHFR